MKYKINLDYEDALTKYIPDEILVKQIKKNISFVEKYLDKIENVFSEEIEKQIAYKQLGIIAFSCVEALWKGVALAINKKCESIQCTEEGCPYNKFDKEYILKTPNIDEILDQLINVRMFVALPFERIAMKELQFLRNHIHLTADVAFGVKDKKFDYKFVDDALRLYYVTLNQVELGDWYLNCNNACLRDFDENGYESTKIQMENDEKAYTSMHLLNFTMDFFWHDQIDEKYIAILNRLRNKKTFDEDMIVKEQAQYLYYLEPRYREEDDYQAALQRYYDVLNGNCEKNGQLVQKIERCRKAIAEQCKIN